MSRLGFTGLKDKSFRKWLLLHRAEGGDNAGAAGLTSAVAAAAAALTRREITLEGEGYLIGGRFAADHGRCELCNQSEGRDGRAVCGERENLVAIGDALICDDGGNTGR